MVNIIAAREEIGKFYYQYGFGEILSGVPQERLAEMISGLAMKGNQSKTTDFAELEQGFRTTYGHFLSKGKWDEQAVSRQQQKTSFEKIAALALEKDAPVYLSIDDTVIEKKKPSSRAKRPMEGTDWHYSHLAGKQVFGYQVFGAHISTGVFTVPSELNPVFLGHQDALYSLLFQAASETVLELCADRKYLGAMPGITAVLHTWGQNLQFHPHIHMIVTGGGLTKEGKWRNSKKHFFLPVRVLSAKFRGKFLAFLNAQFPSLHPSLLDRCYRQKWVVYCKPQR